jgi:tetratricopeptide (TPR) repeat protein
MPYMLRPALVALLLFLPLVSVLAQDTDDAELRLKRADEFLQTKNYKEAISELEKAISLKPDWAEAYFKLGTAHSSIPYTDIDKSSHTKAAIKAFETVVRLKPTWAEAHNELGERYSWISESEKAVESYKEAIRLKPDLADAHVNLAIADLYKARHTEGIESLKEALRIDPNLAKAHKFLGLAYLAQGKRDQALAQYNILKALDTEMAESLYTDIQRPEKFIFGVMAGKLLYLPKPEYPAQLRRMSYQIVVRLLIDETGKVTSARALNGPPELKAVCEAAALKARFKPTKLSGMPVVVTGVVHFNFVAR